MTPRRVHLKTKRRRLKRTRIDRDAQSGAFWYTPMLPSHIVRGYLPKEVSK